MALALLADEWARARGGACLALIADHCLRAASGDEAALTARRLGECGIASHVLELGGLAGGPALAERARTVRYAALEAGCRERGILHLLLGHHAADQAETVAMRMLRGSGPDGLAGIAALVETAWVRLLRPLLTIPPVRLRATLRARGVDWVEDPSNRDPAALRSRLRRLRRDAGGGGAVTAAAARAAAARGEARRSREDAAAAWLGRHARLDPRGFVVLDALPPWPAALAAALRVVGGAHHAPRPRAVAAWLDRPRAATLGGVVLRPAGRLCRGGWLLCREPAAMARGIPARPGAIWDNRVRLLPDCAELPQDAMVTVVPRRGDRPALVGRTLAGLYPSATGATLCWWPPAPLAGSGFVAGE